MEKAIAVETVSQLKNLSSKGFDRLYFGSEACETKIPSVQEAKKAKQFCEKNKLAFSLVTPFCTDFGLNKVKEIFSILSKEDEVVCNDFGVLKEAGRHKPEAIVGRLLNKQFRDPRIASFKGQAAEHLSLSQASMPQFRKLLSSLGVKRVELDNLLQGIGTSLKDTGFSASLYHPIVFVSATRMCLLANAGKISGYKKVGVFGCGKECDRFKFKLGNKAMPKKLFLIGNGLFFENNSLPEEKELLAKGIDRTVNNKALWPEQN